jgi:hypothetical protein
MCTVAAVLIESPNIESKIWSLKVLQDKKEMHCNRSTCSFVLQCLLAVPVGAHSNWQLWKERVDREWLNWLMACSSRLSTTQFLRDKLTIGRLRERHSRIASSGWLAGLARTMSSTWSVRHVFSPDMTFGVVGVEAIWERQVWRSVVFVVVVSVVVIGSF